VIAGYGFEGAHEKCSGSQFLTHKQRFGGKECKWKWSGGRGGRKREKICKSVGPTKKFGNRCHNARHSVSQTNRKISGTGGRTSVSGCKQNISKCTRYKSRKKVQGYCQKFSFRLEF
jgi:hypothetical protein